MAGRHRYLLAVGSNRRHPRHGTPRAVVAAACAELEALGAVGPVSRVLTNAPLGPAQRRFANAAAVLQADRGPSELLEALKAIERAFGRRRGRRWGDRVLDVDIILWSGGALATPNLSIPHPEFRKRRFVMEPASMIAPNWRDPGTGLSLAQLRARLTHPRPLPR